MRTGSSKSKGDRLNWTPLKEVKPVRLNEQLTKGRKLSESDLRERKSSSADKGALLVP